MLDTLAEEFSHDAPVAIEVLFARILGSALLCGLIGLERESVNNPAGLRTNMLIGLAATVFTLVGLQVMQIDPIRLVEAVTAGIAFLAAGVIIYTRQNLTGLTTGASMWLSGGIGLCIGFGMWLVAIVATSAGIIILWLLRKTQVAVGMKDE
jgi:putative Mg2+ transporter-C (MgtC) family protein